MAGSPHRILHDLYRAPYLGTDPGNTVKAIVIDQSPVVIPLVSAAAETRTLAAPTKAGIVVHLVCQTYVGDIVLTTASAYDQAGSTTITFNTAGDYVTLVSVPLAAAYVWRVTGFDGVAGPAIEMELAAITAESITGGDSSLGIAGQSSVAASPGGTVAIVGGTPVTVQNGGPVTIAGGASIAGATGNGGAVSIAGGASGSTAGGGGAVSVTGGLGTTTGAGGAASLIGGAGGAGASSGGLVRVTGGVSGAGATGSGGGVTIAAGANTNTTNGAGGAASLSGGLGKGTGNGGAAYLIGGVSGATGAGGAIAITGGASAGAGGTAGAVAIDTGAATGGTGAAITIGGTNATGVTVGRAGQTTTIPVLDNQTDMAVTAGVGITGTADNFASCVERVGTLIKTTIVIDIDDLNSGGANDDIIGADGAGVAHLGQITAARSGTIFAGTLTCIEAPTGGDEDIDLWSAVEATGVEDTAISDLDETKLCNSGNLVVGSVIPLTAYPAADEYLYLCCGTFTDATYTAGILVIELWGK